MGADGYLRTSTSSAFAGPGVPFLLAGWPRESESVLFPEFSGK